MAGGDEEGADDAIQLINTFRSTMAASQPTGILKRLLLMGRGGDGQAKRDSPTYPGEASISALLSSSWNYRKSSFKFYSFLHCPRQNRLWTFELTPPIPQPQHIVMQEARRTYNDTNASETYETAYQQNEDETYKTDNQQGPDESNNAITRIDTEIPRHQLLLCHPRRPDPRR